MRLCCFAGKTHGGVKRWSMWRILWRNLREREKRIRNIRIIRRVEKKKIFSARLFENRDFTLPEIWKRNIIKTVKIYICEMKKGA